MMTLIILSLLFVVITVLLFLRLWPKKKPGDHNSTAVNAKSVDQHGGDEDRLPREQAIEDLQAHVSRVVAQGFDTQDEIVRSTGEIAEYDYGDHNFSDEISEIVRTAIALQMVDEKTWPEVTDCDRLDRAFEKLQARGIVARQNFACCQNCGHAEIGDEIAEEQKRRTVSGYTFYHQQDTEGAAEGYGLCLAYGSLSGKEEESLAIAEQIVACLNEEGLETDWNGELDKRIQVKLDWRRRYPY